MSNTYSIKCLLFSDQLICSWQYCNHLNRGEGDLTDQKNEMLRDKVTNPKEQAGSDMLITQIIQSRSLTQVHIAYLGKAMSWSNICN